MNIKIYYTEIFGNFDRKKLDGLSFKLPENISRNIPVKKGFDHTKNTVLGKHLLLKALADNGTPKSLYNIKFMSSGKPFINNPHEDFNISHSGNIVACAFSNYSSVGIDIEKIKPVELSDFKNQFSAKEWLKINLSENPLQLFYSYWTMKESVLKADGQGIINSLLPVEIINNNQAKFYGEKWYIHEASLAGNYVCRIASKLKQPVIEYYKMNF